MTQAAKPDIFTLLEDFHALFNFHPMPAQGLARGEYLKRMQQSIKEKKVAPGLIPMSTPQARVS